MRVQRSFLLFLVLFAILALFFVSTQATTAETPAHNQNASSAFLCPPLEGDLYNELWPESGPLPDEDGRWAVNGGTWEVTPGRVQQQDDTANQLNLAYELTSDIADGIIYGCMQVLDMQSGNADFPHGFIFRTDGDLNGYGVGFINENTLALGRRVNGVIEPLQIVTGDYDAEAMNRFKIVIDRARPQLPAVFGFTLPRARSLSRRLPILVLPPLTWTTPPSAPAK